MKVCNRDGALVAISYDEIKTRIAALCSDEELATLDIDKVVIQTIDGIYDGIPTSELDELSARVCANMQSTHFLYDALAARILSSNWHKNVRRKLAEAGRASTFSGKVAHLDASSPGALDEAFVAFVTANAEALDSLPDYARDASHSYFALRTMERSYLMRDSAGACIETPQDMWLRVSVAIHAPTATEGGAAPQADVIERIRDCYGAMSRGFFTHATPTLFNAGTRRNLASCYLLGTDDSLAGIYK